MFAPKLKKGDGVRIIAPSRSLMLPWISDELKSLAQKRLEDLGLNVTFGKHVQELDEFQSSSIENRVEDLHAAFEDESIKLVLTVIGGFNSNQLLRYIDYELIQKNPKILCGYSDITALATAIFAKTGLVTYSGPHFFNFGQQKNFDYTLRFFKQCLFEERPIEVVPSEGYIDDLWATKQHEIILQQNPGWEILNEGEAQGVIIGGNLGTFHLLHGTEYIPDITEDIILFIEDDRDDHAATFDRNLQSLLHQDISSKIRGVVIGRCEQKSGITMDLLKMIIRSKEELKGIPVICGVDFGHTTPMITFPIGGKALLELAGSKKNLRITNH